MLAQEVAVGKGFFAKHGLNTQMVQIQGGPNTVAAIQSSSVAAGIISSPLLFNALGQGAPIVAVAVEVQGFSMQVTVSNRVARERNVTETASTEQMLDYVKGLKIGGQTPGASATAVFQGMLKSSGKPADWTVAMNTGTNEASLAALQNGVIDAMVGGAPSGDLAEARGYGKIVWNSLSIEQFRTGAYGVTAMNPAWAQVHPRVAEGIVAGLDDAQKWILANPDEAVAEAAKLFPTLPVSLLPTILKGTNFAPSSRITEASMKSAQNLANTFQLTASPVSDEVLARSYTAKYFK
jgi:ABC-type nitrate/sulfonate/bicarbonate transport system substrate-binding protein